MTRILYAEDDESCRKSLVRFLKSCGYTEVVTVANGKLAHEKLLNGEQFDVLITDNDMPEMNGFTLINSPEAARIGIRILMSGRIHSITFDKNIWQIPKTPLGISAAELIDKIIKGEELSHSIEAPSR